MHELNFEFTFILNELRMKLDRLRKFNRLIIGGHVMLLSDADLNELRALAGVGYEPVIFPRIPKSREMRKIPVYGCVFIRGRGIRNGSGHTKARRMSKGGAKYVFRKIDNMTAVIIRMA